MNIKPLSSQFCRATALVVLGLLLSAACPAHAQQQLQTEEVQIQRVLNPPATGTFFLLQDKHSPPWPFDPSFGQLPVYEWKPGVYLVDDAGVDYAALKSAGGLGGGMSLMSVPAPCDPCPTNSLTGDPVSFAPAYSYAPTNLWLEITKITNSQAFFVVHTPDPYGAYDLFSTTNLALTTNVAGLNRTNWVWLTRSVEGQTNLTLTNLWPTEGWFQLGTMLDNDYDGLPDAFETLVSKTSNTNADSNANGIRDGDEMGPNGLPWRLELVRRNAAVVYANTPTATEGGACGQFTVYLPAPAPTGGATIKYRSGGSAVPTTDFTTTPSGNTLTISAGASSGTITVCAVNDSEYQDFDRYVEITLTNSTSSAVDAQPARINLVDNDLPAVRVFAFPQWVRKPSPTFGTNTAGFFFVRDGDSTSSVNLNFSVTGSAVSGTDYASLSGTSINFPANVRTNYLPLTLKPTTNTTDRTCTLTISSISGYQIDPAAGAATMTIASSSLTPLPVVQVTATDDDAREAGTNTGTFTFTRSGPTTSPLRVFYHVSGTATVGSTNTTTRDYEELPGYVDFAAGKSSTNVLVIPIDDPDSETVETVVVNLAGGDYQVGTNNMATVYIDDNEAVDYVSEIVREGVHGANASQALQLRVTRTGTALSSASMSWSLIYYPTPNRLSSASAVGDVSGANIVWAARQSVANIYITANWNIQLDETYDPTIKLNGLTEFSTAHYRPQSQLVRLASFGSPATAVMEGTTASTALSITRPYPSSTSSLNVSYAVEGSAVSPADYTALPGAVFFPLGSGGTINVAVQAAVNPQTNGWRTGVVTLNSSGSGYVAEIGHDRAFFRIQDAQTAALVSDTDMDGDGLSDGWELDHQGDGYDPQATNNPYMDSDRDGLALFEEIQLNTNPNVADAAPVYPSEDPDDYVPLTLRLGASGKLTGQYDCSVCHSVGMRAGPHSRTTPRTSWANANNVQDHLVRFLRGTNYPVRLMDNPYSKVLASSETNGALHKYTAAYTAQFLTSAGANYTLVNDTNQLFGTGKAMVLEALAKNATLYVPDLLIAADVDRDGIVNTSNRVDRTSANNPMTFWINDDSDFGSDDTAEDRDPSNAGNPINSSNTVIDNLRDLEDFTRLHFRVEGLPGNLLTNAGLQTRIYLTNLVGTPSLRLFRATETNGALGYLTNSTVATAQTSMGTLGVVASGAPLTLSGSEWKAAGSNRFFLPTIFEGISTGKCVLVFTVSSNGGPDVAISRPFYLDLRRATDLYEHWTVGDTNTIYFLPEQIPNRATRTADSAVFGSPQKNDEADYILFVHGWRMLPWERRAFASTAYKRLWHLGYKGRFGLFSWPTDWVNDPLWQKLIDPQNFDRSERRAFNSAAGLERLLVDLNKTYPDRVRLMAHSMGNVVASEALRLKGLGVRRPVLHTYVASQAASVAHAYDAVNPETVLGNFPTRPPETYAHFPLTGQPYFAGMTNAVTFNSDTQRRRIVNYQNSVDYALTTPWLFNQFSKPDDAWEYVPFAQVWRRKPNNAEGFAVLEFERNAYEMYAHLAVARSRALGAAEVNGFSVRGQIGEQIDLHSPPFSYGDHDYEHSAEFRSINMRRGTYWSQLLNTFGIFP